MTDTELHLVQRFTFDFSVEELRKARLLHDRLSQVFSNRLTGIMEEVCDALHDEQYLLQIHSLELDLGDLSEVDLEEELVFKFRRALWDALSLAKLNASFHSSGRGRMVDLLSAKKHILTYFLLRGHLPGSAIHLSGSIDEIFQELLESYPEELRELLREVGSNDSVSIQRLTKRFGGPTIFEIIRLLAPDYHISIAQFIQDAARTMESRQITSFPRALNLLSEASVRVLLQSSGGQFSYTEYMDQVRLQLGAKTQQKTDAVLPLTSRDPESAASTTLQARYEPQLEVIRSIMGGEATAIDRQRAVYAWDELSRRNLSVLVGEIRRRMSRPADMFRLMEELPTNRIFNLISSLIPTQFRSLVRLVRRIIAVHSRFTLGFQAEREFRNVLYGHLVRYVLDASSKRMTYQAFAAYLKRSLELSPLLPRPMLGGWDEMVEELGNSVGSETYAKDDRDGERRKGIGKQTGAEDRAMSSGSRTAGDVSSIMEMVLELLKSGTKELKEVLFQEFAQRSPQQKTSLTHNLLQAVEVRERPQLIRSLSPSIVSGLPQLIEVLGVFFQLKSEFPRKTDLDQEAAFQWFYPLRFAMDFPGELSPPAILIRYTIEMIAAASGISPQNVLQEFNRIVSEKMSGGALGFQELLSALPAQGSFLAPLQKQSAQRSVQFEAAYFHQESNSPGTELGDLTTPSTEAWTSDSPVPAWHGVESASVGIENEWGDELEEEGEASEDQESDLAEEEVGESEGDWDENAEEEVEGQETDSVEEESEIAGEPGIEEEVGDSESDWDEVTEEEKREAETSIPEVGETLPEEDEVSEDREVDSAEEESEFAGGPVVEEAVDESEDDWDGGADEEEASPSVPEPEETSPEEDEASEDQEAESIEEEFETVEEPIVEEEEANPSVLEEEKTFSEEGDEALEGQEIDSVDEESETSEEPVVEETVDKSENDWDESVEEEERKTETSVSEVGETLSEEDELLEDQESDSDVDESEPVEEIGVEEAVRESENDWDEGAEEEEREAETSVLEVEETLAEEDEVSEEQEVDSEEDESEIAEEADVEGAVDESESDWDEGTEEEEREAETSVPEVEETFSEEEEESEVGGESLVEEVVDESEDDWDENTAEEEREVETSVPELGETLSEEDEVSEDQEEEVSVVEEAVYESEDDWDENTGEEEREVETSVPELGETLSEEDEVSEEQEVDSEEDESEAVEGIGVEEGVSGSDSDWDGGADEEERETETSVPEVGGTLSEEDEVSEDQEVDSEDDKSETAEEAAVKEDVDESESDWDEGTEEQEANPSVPEEAEVLPEEGDEALEDQEIDSVDEESGTAEEPVVEEAIDESENDWDEGAEKEEREAETSVPELGETLSEEDEVSEDQEFDSEEDESEIAGEADVKGAVDESERDWDEGTEEEEQEAEASSPEIEETLSQEDEATEDQKTDSEEDESEAGGEPDVEEATVESDSDWAESSNEEIIPKEQQREEENNESGLEVELDQEENLESENTIISSEEEDRTPDKALARKEEAKETEPDSIQLVGPNTIDLSEEAQNAELSVSLQSNDSHEEELNPWLDQDAFPPAPLKNQNLGIHNLLENGAEGLEFKYKHPSESTNNPPESASPLFPSTQPKKSPEGDTHLEELLEWANLKKGWNELSVVEEAETKDADTVESLNPSITSSSSFGQQDQVQPQEPDKDNPDQLRRTNKPLSQESPTEEDRFEAWEIQREATWVSQREKSATKRLPQNQDQPQVPSETELVKYLLFLLQHGQAPSWAQNWSLPPVQILRHLAHRRSARLRPALHLRWKYVATRHRTEEALRTIRLLSPRAIPSLITLMAPALSIHLRLTARLIGALTAATDHFFRAHTFQSRGEQSWFLPIRFLMDHPKGPARLEELVAYTVQMLAASAGEPTGQVAQHIQAFLESAPTGKFPGKVAWQPILTLLVAGTNPITNPEARQSVQEEKQALERQERQNPEQQEPKENQRRGGKEKRNTPPMDEPTPIDGQLSQEQNTGGGSEDDTPSLEAGDLPRLRSEAAEYDLGSEFSQVGEARNGARDNFEEPELDEKEKKKIGGEKIKGKEEEHLISGEMEERADRMLGWSDESADNQLKKEQAQNPIPYESDQVEALMFLIENGRFPSWAKAWNLSPAEVLLQLSDQESALLGPFLHLRWEQLDISKRSEEALRTMRLLSPQAIPDLVALVAPSLSESLQLAARLSAALIAKVDHFFPYHTVSSPAEQAWFIPLRFLMDYRDQARRLEDLMAYTVAMWTAGTSATTAEIMDVLENFEGVLSSELTAWKSFSADHFTEPIPFLSPEAAQSVRFEINRQQEHSMPQAFPSDRQKDDDDSDQVKPAFRDENTAPPIEKSEDQHRTAIPNRDEWEVVEEERDTKHEATDPNPRKSDQISQGEVSEEIAGEGAESVNNPLIAGELSQPSSELLGSKMPEQEDIFFADGVDQDLEGPSMDHPDSVELNLLEEAILGPEKDVQAHLEEKIPPQLPETEVERNAMAEKEIHADEVPKKSADCSEELKRELWKTWSLPEQMDWVLEQINLDFTTPHSPSTISNEDLASLLGEWVRNHPAALLTAFQDAGPFTKAARKRLISTLTSELSSIEVDRFLTSTWSAAESEIQLVGTLIEQIAAKGPSLLNHQELKNPQNFNQQLHLQFFFDHIAQSHSPGDYLNFTVTTMARMTQESPLAIAGIFRAALGYQPWSSTPTGIQLGAQLDELKRVETPQVSEDQQFGLSDSPVLSEDVEMGEFIALEDEVGLEKELEREGGAEGEEEGSERKLVEISWRTRKSEEEKNEAEETTLKSPFSEEVREPEGDETEIKEGGRVNREAGGSAEKPTEVERGEEEKNGPEFEEKAGLEGNAIEEQPDRKQNANSTEEEISVETGEVIFNIRGPEEKSDEEKLWEESLDSAQESDDERMGE